MKLITSRRAEDKYDSLDTVVAPGGWCCCCCCWCHIGNITWQEQEETLEGATEEDTR